jgi:hypothetical protein
VKFREYWSKLNEQQSRLIGCPIATQVEESLCLDNQTVSIALGKSNGVTVDGDLYALSMLPRNYTNLYSLFRKYNEDFVNILQILTDRIDEVVEASTELPTIIADQDIPELVLDRMAGAQLGEEPAELVQTIAIKRLRQLRDKVIAAESPFDEVNLSVTVAGSEFTIQKNNNSYQNQITWSDFGYSSQNGREFVNGTPQALAIIANYKKLEQAVDRFIAMLKRAGKTDEE